MSLFVKAIWMFDRDINALIGATLHQSDTFVSNGILKRYMCVFGFSSFTSMFYPIIINKLYL